jgi:tRNA (guanine37-N1)-methyltransferase
MRFDIITLFPDFFQVPLSQGITRRAYETGRVQVQLWSLRDFADNNYRRVDDRCYGGGPGMVLMAEPILKTIDAITASRSLVGLASVIHFTPTGKPLTQTDVTQWSRSAGAILLCGRYEGIDQRVLDQRVDVEYSLGDFVLSGGELPAMAFLDAIARLQEGVLGDVQSHQQDSFSDGLLDCPHYSRPEQLTIDGQSQSVPEVLMSGHHEKIAQWRRERSLELTCLRRPDLIETARSSGKLSAKDEQFLKRLAL